MRVSGKTLKEYTLIYEHFYGKFVRSMRGKRPFRVSPQRQVTVIDTVLASLPYEYANAVRLKMKYLNFTTASKVSSIPKKKLTSYYDTAVKRMLSPKNIELAVPGYYPKPRTEEEEVNFHRLTEEDFGNNKYVITALHKSNIYYREQLMKHLSTTWFHLWTIPGCGDGARQKILLAIDKWEGRGDK